MVCNNPNLDLVNINAYTKFGKIQSMRSQDEWKRNSDINQQCYAVIISKYTTKIVGTQKRQVACVHGTQDQKQSIFNTFKPAQ